MSDPDYDPKKWLDASQETLHEVLGRRTVKAMPDPKMVEVILDNLIVYDTSASRKWAEHLDQRLHDAGYRMVPSVEDIRMLIEKGNWHGGGHGGYRWSAQAIHDLMLNGGE